MLTLRLQFGEGPLDVTETSLGGQRHSAMLAKTPKVPGHGFRATSRILHNNFQRAVQIGFTILGLGVPNVVPKVIRS